MAGRIFSFDDQTVTKIKEESEKLHLCRSAFLRFLVWTYVNDCKGLENKRGGG